MTISRQIDADGEKQTQSSEVAIHENIAHTAPDEFLSDHEFDPHLFDLIRLHLAQFHSSRIGIEQHSRDLRKRGETEERLRDIRDWPCSILFNKRERFALALADAITACPESAVAKTLINNAKLHFSRPELLSLIVAIHAVNDWNE